MILTPKVFLLVIGTGLYWLLAIVAFLLLVAGFTRGDSNLLISGIVGCAVALVIGMTFKRNESRISQWARTQ